MPASIYHVLTATTPDNPAFEIRPSHYNSVHAVTLAVVLLRWHGHAADLAYPCINLVTHSGVGWCVIIITRNRRYP